jgi:hypothetical protein
MYLNVLVADEFAAAQLGEYVHGLEHLERLRV